MSRRTPKRAYDSHATRERILDAAMDLFQRRGYHGTSMQELQQAADVPGGSMYHSFPTKRGLALAVIHERVMAEVVATWVEPVQRARDVDQAILAVFHGVARHIDAKHRVVGCPVTNLAVELASVDPELRDALNAAYDAWATAIATRLAERYTKRRAEELATWIVAVFSGAMSLAKTANSSQPLVRCAKQVRTLLATA
ncbi:MAG: helix-turn-helix domain-containing protein [Kofleriaceae bacterium]